MSVYVASRASVAARPRMWQELREHGWDITSTWIDEAGEGETADLGELWQRIEREIAASDGLVLYAQPEDFPLKGAMVEVGIALGIGKRVGMFLPGCILEPRSLRPLGSWAWHPLCRRYDSLLDARRWADGSLARKLPKNVAEIRGLIDRLSGIYTVPVNDGAGLLNGKSTFTRTFPVPPINKEAAAVVLRLALALADIAEADVPAAKDAQAYPVQDRVYELKEIAQKALGLEVSG